MNRVKIHPKMRVPPFPCTAEIEFKVKLSLEPKNGIATQLCFYPSYEYWHQLRLIDTKSNVKTDWSPVLRSHKATWWLWGQYCLQLRRNSHS